MAGNKLESEEPIGSFRRRDQFDVGERGVERERGRGKSCPPRFFTSCSLRPRAIIFLFRRQGVREREKVNGGRVDG